MVYGLCGHFFVCFFSPRKSKQSLHNQKNMDQTTWAYYERNLPPYWGQVYQSITLNLERFIGVRAHVGHYVLPEAFTSILGWFDRSITLAGSKQGVIGYEIMLSDFFFGVVAWPLIFGILIGVSTWAFVLAYRTSRGFLNLLVCMLDPVLLVLSWGSFILRSAFGFPRRLASAIFTPRTLVWMYYVFVFVGELPLLPFRFVGAVLCLAVEILPLCGFLLVHFLHPSGLPLASEQGRLARGDNKAVGTGRRRALREGLAHVSASGALTRVPRLRPRGRATRMLQDALEGPVGAAGKFFRGRWTPDLPLHRRSPVFNGLLAASGSEMKLLGCGAVRSTGATPKDHVYVVVESSEGVRELIIPALTSRLAQYSFLRESNAELLRGLRARAVDWFKQEELPLWIGDLVLPTAVARACMTSSTDRLARSMLANAGKEALLSPST